MRKGGGFSDMLERTLDSDSKGRFVKLIQKHPSEITKSLVEKCAEFGAQKCLLALLNGEVCECDALPALVDDHSPSSNALTYVAHSCPDPQIIHLMLNRCNAIPLVNVTCSFASVHGLPIHFVLLHLSYLEHLYPWIRGDYLIKLIILLCQWKTKPILDSARLLAQYTDSINDIAWTFVNFGALKQFGALLLVAREKVMAPFDTGLTIHQRLANEIDSFSKTDIGSEQAEYKNILIDARQLLDVFERAGDALGLYCSSMQKNVAMEEAIADVCELLKKSKVHVIHGDLKLDIYFREHRAVSKINSLSSKILAPARFESKKGDWLNVPPAGDSFSNFLLQSGYRPVRNSMGLLNPVRFMSTTACHMKNSISPAAQHLAYRTVMKLKKGLRFL
ncbi:uncharacterized protein LOC110722861 [Chenopodium quinoa]|uniref:Uncharacterized protein n=1 Tax=Chenopodium quinoa TaxID=63459 RepID=A0A803LX14_CHEQI|nr:uncharacterized protein LOC110722861 [Chenopodium quinoa]